MLNGLSFDIEEWYHAELVRRHVSAAGRISQVEQATEPILDMLARRKLRATFFVVGEVLRDHPALVRAIADGGHEIGCHSMSHCPLWDMTPETLCADLREWRALWGATMGASHPVTGFRAPTFSIGQKTRWALSVLAEEGFCYDSSIFPVANYMYGLNGGPLAAYRPDSNDLRCHDPNGPLVELPMTVWEVAGWRLPVSGGAYLRALPMPLLMHALHQVAKERPIVLYMHPWEMHDKAPAVQGMTVTERIITSYNRSSALAKLERILDEFPFGPLYDVLRPLLGTRPPAAGQTAEVSSLPHDHAEAGE